MWAGRRRCGGGVAKGADEEKRLDAWWKCRLKLIVACTISKKKTIVACLGFSALLSSPSFWALARPVWLSSVFCRFRNFSKYSKHVAWVL